MHQPVVISMKLYVTASQLIEEGTINVKAIAKTLQACMPGVLQEITDGKITVEIIAVAYDDDKDFNRDLLSKN